MIISHWTLMSLYESCILTVGALTFTVVFKAHFAEHVVILTKLVRAGNKPFMIVTYYTYKKL